MGKKSLLFGLLPLYALLGCSPAGSVLLNNSEEEELYSQIDVQEWRTSFLADIVDSSSVLSEMNSELESGTITDIIESLPAELRIVLDEDHARKISRKKLIELVDNGIYSPLYKVAEGFYSGNSNDIVFVDGITNRSVITMSHEYVHAAGYYHSDDLIDYLIEQNEDPEFEFSPIRELDTFIEEKDIPYLVDSVVSVGAMTYPLVNEYICFWYNKFADLTFDEWVEGQVDLYFDSTNVTLRRLNVSEDVFESILYDYQILYHEMMDEFDYVADNGDCD